MGTVDIFIKSYQKDFWLLQIALETIKKNVVGYNSVVLLIPEQEKNLFDTRNLPDRTLIHYVVDKEHGWLMQQVFKMQAHKYCNADYIMFTDSDCLFCRPIDVRESINNGKPEILYTSWDSVGDAICWKEPTEKFLKAPVEFEMMRRNQQVYHRSTLVALSKFEPNIEEKVMGSDRFSEFNTMSSFAYQHEKDKYTFTNTLDGWTYTEPLAEQLWSHGNKDAGASETHLREWIRTLESIIKALGLSLPKI